jgi:hypothetical protein
MAFVAKNVQKPGPGRPVVAQWINVSRGAQAVAPATDILFRVYGGRILAHLILGEVTTVIATATTNTKVSSKKLDGAPAAVGTAVDLCANVDGNAKEVGSLFVILGSGAAAIWSNAGAGLATLGRNAVIIPQGEIYATYGGASTGAMKWDIWYQPLDPGAYVVANGVQTVI